jgi:hypothetical protein
MSRRVGTGLPLGEDHSRDRVHRLYAGYAALFLGVTLLSGVWLRGAFVQPEVMRGFAFAHVLHAHSHLAFFGWTSMALFALIARRSRLGVQVPWLRWHAHAMGVASAAAFVGFLLGGYNAFTIAISVVHVLIWATFVAEAWGPVGALARVERMFARGALAFLALAGAGALTPGFVMARGINDPWIGQVAIYSFLSPFMAGWLMLGAMGAVYAAVERPRYADAALWLTLAGALPAALLHPSAPPPTEWLLLVGRSGTLALGLGTAFFALDVLSAGARVAPLLRLAVGAAAVKGVAEIAVSLGIGLELASVRPITIAYLHLVLLGVVTPALMAAGLRLPHAPLRTAAYAAGLGLMLACLVALGYAPATVALVAIGVTPATLYWGALVGGAGTALAGIAMMAGQRRAREGHSDRFRTPVPEWRLQLDPAPVAPLPVAQASPRG